MLHVYIKHDAEHFIHGVDRVFKINLI